FMFFFSSRRRHTRFSRDWSSDVWSSDLVFRPVGLFVRGEGPASRGRRPQENLKNSRRGNMNDNIRQYARAARLALAAALGLALCGPPALAQSQDGSLAGQSVPGAEVTVRNPNTGFTRTVTAGADGSFRFPFLPVGEYLIEARRNGETIAQPAPVTVFLGKTTHVNAGSQDLDVIQVVGSRTPAAIHVTS